MKLKAKLVIIGGAKDKGLPDDEADFTKGGILTRIVEESRKKLKSRIEVITTPLVCLKRAGKTTSLHSGSWVLIMSACWLLRPVKRPMQRTT